MVHCYFNVYMYYTAHFTHVYVFIFHSKLKKGCVFNCLSDVKGYVIRLCFKLC